MRSSMLKGSRRWRSLRRCLMVVVFGLLTFGTNNEATRIETFETTFQLSIKKDEGLQYWTDLSLKPEEKSPRSICAGFMILVKQCYAFLAANLAGCKDGFFAYDDSGIQGNLSIYIIQFQIRPTTLDAWREHIEDTFLKLAHEHLEQANSGSSKGTSTIQLKGMRMLPVEALEVSAKVKSSNGEPPDVYKKDLTNDFYLLMASLGMLGAVIGGTFDDIDNGGFGIYLDYKQMVDNDIDLCGPMLLKKWLTLLNGAIPVTTQTGFIAFYEVKHTKLLQITTHLHAKMDAIPLCNGPEKEMVSLILEVRATVKSSNGESPDVYKKDLTNDLQLIRSSTPVHDIRIERNSVSRSNYHSVYVYLDVYRMSKLVPEIVSQTNQVFKLEDWLQEMQVLVAFGYQKDLWIWRTWVQAHKVCFGPYRSTN